MKKIISVILFLAFVVSLVYMAAFASEVTFDSPVERDPVESVELEFLQVNLKQRSLEVFYTVPSLGSGQINSAVVATADELASNPQFAARMSNITVEVTTRIKQMAATNGLTFK